MPTLHRDNKIISFPLDTKNFDKLAQLIPDVQWHYIEGRFYTPFTLDLVKFLQGLGADMADWEVMRHRYTFPKVQMIHDMYWWQVETAVFLTTVRRGFCLNSPRTGKTASAAAAADFLIQRKETKQFLIVTPTSCILSVWEQELNGLFPNRKVTPLTGTKKQRLKKLASKDTDFFIINPDGISRVPEMQKAILAKVTAGDISAGLIDESTEFGNVTSGRWKAAKPVCDALKFLWLMTGTPGDPMTVYGQAKLMDSNSVPPTQEVWQAITMYPANTFKVGQGNRTRNVTKWLPNEASKDHIKRVLEPAMRIRKEDVMKDIPSAIKIPMYGPLSEKQLKLYQTLDKNRVVSINGDVVQADNAALLAGMLMQITSGTLKYRIDDEEKVLRIPMQEKLDLLMQIIKETPGKKLLFANNIATLELLNDHVKAKGYSSEIVNGSVTGTNRADKFKRFIKEDDPHILCCHLKTVSYGVELGLADAIIWFGVPFASAFMYQQANERLLSSKQLSDTPAIYQIYSTTREKQAFRALDSGVDWQQAVSDLFKI